MAEVDTTQAGLGPETADTDDRTGILIVVPVFQAVYARPFANFLAIMLAAAHREGARYRFDVRVPERQMLHGAMNQIGEIVLEHGHQAVIVFDDDCFPPFDCVSRLLRHFEAGRAFVAGAGIMRGFPHTTTIGQYYPEGLTLEQHGDTMRLAGFRWVDDLRQQPPLLEADFSGLPVALIAREVFERVPAPWFGTHIDGGDCTHDVYFARKLKAAGIPRYVDTTMRCHHLADAPVMTFENREIARRLKPVVSQLSGVSA